MFASRYDCKKEKKDGEMGIKSNFQSLNIEDLAFGESWWTNFYYLNKIIFPKLSTFWRNFEIKFEMLYLAPITTHPRNTTFGHVQSALFSH